MFYSKLSEIMNDGVNAEFIESLDAWFAFLPSTEKDKITASKVSIKFGVSYYIAEVTLEKCQEIGILERRYAIQCPNCDHILKITTEDDLYEQLSKIDYCYACEEEGFEITGDNILVVYKLMKRPDTPPDAVRKGAKNVLKYGISKGEGPYLNDLISDNKINANNFFYSPTDEEKKELKRLISELDKDFSNTKEKGDALEDLAIYLLDLVKSFKVTKLIRTPTNQIDVFIRNTFKINSFVFEHIGSHAIVECKNENKKPNNTYYHKLRSIIRNSDSKFGIVFSLLPATSTCYTIAREVFLLEKMIIINFSKDDINYMLENDSNFLDIIESKIYKIKINSTVDLDTTELF